MYQQRIRTFISIALPQLIWLTLTLLLARAVMFYYFTDERQLLGNESDVWRMWATGVRYDFRVTGLFISLLFLPSLLFACQKNIWNIWQKSLHISIPLITFVTTLAAISNYFFYQTYHTHFDVFVFALAEDDTLSVLKNIYQDYPVFGILGLGTLSALISYWLTKRFTPSIPLKEMHWGIFLLYLVTVILVLTILSRGSVGTFPLRENDAQVSDVRALNKLTPNALIALHWAYKHKQEDISFKRVKQTQGDRLQHALGIPSLTESTPKNSWLADHPPHVVMNLMESFGSNMLELDIAGKNDLLGGLRPHFDSDFVFKRFVSEHNGTAPSFAALFFQSPMENISQSSAQKTKLDLIPFDVYRNAGYRVVFVSPGNMAWRNFANYLPTQGALEVYDQSSLIDMYPEAESELTAWGIPDDYAYRLADQLLQQSNEPMLLVILTVTNHPPYVTPARYQAQPVSLTDNVIEHVVEGSIGIDYMLTTFQYAADAFGQFISGIKSSPIAEKTIIAATGDHQMRRMHATYPREQVIDRAVPFYLHVPKTVLDHTDWRYEPDRIGSHKDIFPTLYHFSLSDRLYRSLAGRNMMATDDDPARAFGYNDTLWIDEQGAYPLDSQHVLYRWVDDTGLALDTKAEVPSIEQLEKLSALPQLLRWQINARIKGVKE